ncbi:DMT family transporter [Desulfosarcina cetonica]|uniref:DMT family transporter n=1 Tax=Desulfosarcina cetonica TaxID=90730 RepID=UPI000B10D6CD|nr:EamA family transporter [Desulfosarcina cetonica]
MPARHLKSDILFLITAIIWGFAFVAQRIGMDHVGPFTFNGLRFFLGAMVLLPFILHGRRRSSCQPENTPSNDWRSLVGYGGLAGLALFGGASLQQVGLVYTTAGKAGFITGLYVVIVPIMGLLWRQHTHAGTWLGALMAASGLYLLSIKADLTISFGDFLVLMGALLWAAHIHLIGWVSPRTNALPLAFVQFLVCAMASLATAWAVESVGWADLVAPHRRSCTAACFPLAWPTPSRWWLSVMPTRPTPPFCSAWSRSSPRWGAG